MSLENSYTTTQPITWPQAQYMLRYMKREGQYNTLLMFAAGFYFGLRIGDILSLKWADIQKDQFTVVEEKTRKKDGKKSYKRRIINVHADFRAHMRFVESDIGVQDPEHYVFIYQRSDGNPYDHITVRAANKRIKKAFLETGINAENPSSHTLRKTFGRRVFEMSGRSEEALLTLSDIFNHSSPAITRRYIGLTKEKIKNVYLSL